MAIDFELLARVRPGTTYTKVYSRVFPELGGVEVALVRVTEPADGDVDAEQPDGARVDIDREGEEGEWGEEEGRDDDDEGDDDEGDALQVMTDADACYEARGDRMQRVFDVALHRRCLQAIELATPDWLRAYGCKHAVEWEGVSASDTVMQIVETVWAGRWIGQAMVRTLSFQSLAWVLIGANLATCENVGDIWRPVVEQLRAEGRLDLVHDEIAAPVAGFRFPDELAELLRYVIEEPLGWPNGEAGDCALATITGAIEAHTQFKRGQDLVHAENSPRLAPRHLVDFGVLWLKRAVARDAAGEEAFETAGHRATLVSEIEALLHTLRTPRAVV